MANSICISHITPPPTIYFILLMSTVFRLIAAVNITQLLSPYPDFSDFSNLLSTTAVAADLSRRTSITLLAVPNSVLRSSDLITRSSTNVADVLRYHVLLQYLSLHDLRTYPPSGELITTLFQTTGRAPGTVGSVNVTYNPITETTIIRSPENNATVISQIVTLPYNITIFSLNSLIIPSGYDLMASESDQPPLGVDITRVLIDGHNFNIAASMFSASGVAQELESEHGGAGITVLVPTDAAFSELPESASFQSLPAEYKTDVLRFHVLHSYYPLGSLELIVNPMQPTLATEDKGAGSFTLNISRVNGSVAISTGMVEASVTQTVFDQNPIAIFGISRVLLPKEIYGKKTSAENAHAVGVTLSTVKSPPPPTDLPGLYRAPSSSPPVVREVVHSTAIVRKVNLGLLCTGLIYVLLAPI